MLTKTIILILSAFLLLQTKALPRMRRGTGEEVAVEHKQTNVIADDSDSSSASSEELDIDVKKLRQILMTTTLVDLVGLAEYVTVNGRPIMKKAHEQLEALPEKSATLQANISRIDEFLKTNPENMKATEEEGIMALFESMIKFTDIMKDVDDMPTELEETKIIQKAFADNGAEKFEDDLMAELKIVTGKFEKSIEKYLNAISEKQKTKETKLIDWYNKFTNEKDDEKKAEHYSNFFDTFKP